MAQLPLDQAITRFQQNDERLDKFANGGATESYVSSLGASVPSIQKFLATKNNEINVGASSVLALATAQAENAEDSAIASAASAASATDAVAAKVAAEAARDAAIIGAGVYTTEAAGRAAVADGVAFKVQGSGDVAAYEYRRTNSTTSVLIATYPSAAGVPNKITAALPLVRNLYDVSRAENGKVLEPTDGLTYVNEISAPYSVSGFIAVEPNATYICNKESSSVVFYSENKVRLSNTTFSSNTSFTAPAAAYFIRFDVTPLSVISSMMFVAGAALPSAYISFGYDDAATTARKTLATVRPDIELSLPAVRNLFDSARAESGKVLEPTDGLTYVNEISADYFVTGLIPVLPGSTYISNKAGGAVVYYTEGKVRLSNTTFLAATGFVAPAGAYYVRFQVYSPSNISSLVVVAGSVLPAGYLPFGNGVALPWQGKGLLIQGDSISATGYYIPYLVAGTGTTLVANNGVPGRAVRDMSKNAAGSELVAGDLANVDLISIFGGTNDYGGARTLGTIADAYAGSVVASFYNDVFQLLTKLYTLKPIVRIMFSTPLMRGAFESQPVYPAANSTGAKLPQYVQAIKEVCALFGTPVCDLFSTSGINLVNLTTYTADNLHPNTIGGALHARPMIAIANAA